MNISTYIIPVLSLAGFLAHTLANWLQDFGPGLTEVENVVRNLTDIPFPVLFQLSVIPAFRTDRLEELGYGQPFFYFAGETSDNSFIGWNEPNKSVSETFHSLVTMKNLNEIISEMIIMNALNNSDSVVVPLDIPIQPFYINNRFILDISDYILKDFKKSRNFVVTINNSKSLACDMLTFCNRCGTVIRGTSLEQLSVAEFSGE